METGYVLMTTIDGIDMFYGTCDVEGDIVEPGLIGAFMTSDIKELHYIKKSLNRMDGLHKPSCQDIIGMMKQKIRVRRLNSIGI